MRFHNIYFITGTAYAGKSTMTKLLREKQFLYRLMLEEPDPEAALENFRQCLARVNSQESYDHFLHSGFPVILRDEERSIEQTLALVEKAFGLESALPAFFEERQCLAAQTECGRWKTHVACRSSLSLCL